MAEKSPHFRIGDHFQTTIVAEMAEKVFFVFSGQDETEEWHNRKLCSCGFAW